MRGALSLYWVIYFVENIFSLYSVSVIIKPQVFNLKLVTQQIEMFLPQKITDPEIVAILQDGWLRCKEFSTSPPRAIHFIPAAADNLILVHGFSHLQPARHPAAEGEYLMREEKSIIQFIFTT